VNRAALAVAALAAAAPPASGQSASAAPAATAPAAAPSASPPSPTASPAAASKKDRDAAAKSTRHGPPPAPGAHPARLVHFHNLWTHEWLAVDPAAPPPRATVDHFLRDHFTNKSTAMEPRLLGMLVAAAERFHRDVVNVVSGFRHPKYNLILRKKGHQVARDSQHSHGDAVDFFLPDVSAPVLQAWAVAQRIGGVGLYPESGFVHMDTGPIRRWSGE
jgi:uncharacterized protein YcbK (DUF882 family)